MQIKRISLTTILLLISSAFIANPLQAKIAADKVCKNNPTITEASFVGGWDNLYDWLLNNVQYPPMPNIFEIESEVGAFFDIETDGSIENIWLFTAGYPEFDNEAYRLIKEMPKWIPKQVNGVYERSGVSIILKFRKPTENDPDNIKLLVPIMKEDDNPFEMLVLFRERQNMTSYPGMNVKEINNNIKYAYSQASFKGGPNALMNYLSQNIIYPAEASKNHIEGRVIVSFIIEEDGRISNAYILERNNSMLEEEALRLVKSMPYWIPATLFGMPIKSPFRLPVTFKVN